ncbi:MAG: V-type ATP synthase subunit F [Candidatus Thorarchaeota archaeon]
MAERIIIVAGADVNLGFQLAGIVTYSVVDTISAQKKIETLLNESDIGLIAIADYFYSGFDDIFKRKLETLSKPVIVSIPFEEKPDKRKLSQEAIKYVEAVIVQNSGIHIRLS